MLAIGDEDIVRNLCVSVAYSCSPKQAALTFCPPPLVANGNQVRAKVLFLRRTIRTSTSPSPDAMAYMTKAFR